MMDSTSASYRGDRKPYRPPIGEGSVDLAELEGEFEL
jgi:hypothetical protein